eukprot:TRINITY_DN2711_c0_g1_i1.p1 TRINITY_DN2711_c0_g1~~TRINITY_DN2711_c0_g1_i1.p1  ORF type:complete len:429 (+),score=79.84 TRINITY_DN2711_c0_g1_i1:1631-2917(+)
MRCTNAHVMTLRQSSPGGGEQSGGERDSGVVDHERVSRERDEPVDSAGRTMREFHVSQFPCEMIEHVFSFLDPSGMKCAMAVCQRWHTIITERKVFWRVAAGNLSFSILSPPEVPDRPFIAALNTSIRSLNVDGVSFCLRAGFTLDGVAMTNRLMPSPFHLACCTPGPACVDVLKMLVDVGKAGPMDLPGFVPSLSVMTPLSFAACHSNLPAVKFLIDRGAHLDGTESPLHLTWIGGDTEEQAKKLETLRTLLEAGADVNTRSTFGRNGVTPLINVSMSHSLLFDIDEGAEWAQQEEKSASETAAQAVDVAKELLKYGADINAATKVEESSGHWSRVKARREGTTATMNAIRCRMFPLARFLIQHPQFDAARVDAFGMNARQFTQRKLNRLGERRWEWERKGMREILVLLDEKEREKEQEREKERNLE